MSKVDALTPVANFSTGSAVTIVNANYDKIVEGFNNTLSRDGSSPNHMDADLDMNGNDIINVGAIDATNFVFEGVNFGDLIDQAEAAATDAEAAATQAEAAADAAELAAASISNNWTIAYSGVGTGVVDDLYTLTIDPGSVNNMFVVIDGIAQMVSHSDFELTYVLTVPKIKITVPLGLFFEVKCGNALIVGTPSDGSITSVKIANNAVGLDKLADVATLTFLGRKAAGTGDPAALTLADLRDSFFPAGSVIDSKIATYTANANLSAIIPTDDTIPQITEGTEIISTTFTMKSTTNILRLRFNAAGAFSVNGVIVAAIFVAGDSNAKVSGLTAVNGVDVFIHNIVASGEYVPGVLTPLTISVRVGPNGAGNVRLNGNTSGRFMGGTLNASLLIEEIKV